MSRARRKTFREPIIYEVGKDITPEQFEDIIVAMGDWFREFRPKSTEPMAMARKRLNECLLGVKTDGTPWFDMADSTLAARVRSKCRFDIDTMQPIRVGSEKQKLKRAKERTKKLEKRKNAKVEFIPEELREEARKAFKYGHDPKVFLSSAEHDSWQELFDEYIVNFPELSTINARAELESLCDAHVLKSRYRSKILAGQTVDPQTLAAIDKQLIDMKKALGIHPDQLAKRVKPKNEHSVGSAVARLESMGDAWKELRERHWIEELIQLYQRYHTLKADGTGYQLDDVALYGLTRTRPIACPNCNTVHFEGLTIDKIEEYLIRKKAIELIDPDDPEYADPEIISVEHKDIVYEDEE